MNYKEAFVDGELNILKEIRRLMKPLPESYELKKSMWIAGQYRTKEEYVLINLRQKVLKRIDGLERIKEKLNK